MGKFQLCAWPEVYFMAFSMASAIIQGLTLHVKRTTLNLVKHSEQPIQKLVFLCASQFQKKWY